MEPGVNFDDGRRRLRLAIVAVAVMIVTAIGTGAAAAASGPLVNSKFADRPVKPTAFSPNNIAELAPGGRGFNNFVRGIEWTTWGGAEAEGAGRVSLLRSDGSTSPVTIFLSAPARCAGVRVYTAYHLLLAPGAAKPKGWPKGQSGRFPCRLSIGTYSGQRLGRSAPCVPGLRLPGRTPAAPVTTAPWRPTPPGRFWPLCQLRIGNWGQQQANGTGAVTRGVNGAFRIWLMRPFWCPRVGEGVGGAITYGKLKIRFKGSPPAGQPRNFVQEIRPPSQRCRLGTGEAA
jgi:hypothetical protein